MDSRPDWMHSVDVAILDYLREERLDYAPLIASQLGLHLGYTETRCDLLAEHGFVEPVSQEVVYRLTDDGHAVLDETTEADVDLQAAHRTGQF